MKLIERYIFKITHQAFWACLLAVTAVIWITSALREIDLLTSKGQTALVFFSITLLTLPGLIAFVASFTLLIAVLYALNRLNSDSELIVMNAAGIRPAALFKPFLTLGIIVSVLVWGIVLYAMPLALYNMRSLTNKIRADFISFFVKEGEFPNLEGLTFHYKEKTGNILNNMLIQDRRDPNKVSTYLAKRAYTKETDDRSFLILEDGSVQTQSTGKKDSGIVAFSQYSIDLSTLQEHVDAGRKPSERTTYALLYPPAGDPMYTWYPSRFTAELHERLSSGLFPLAMVFIGFACLGNAHTTRTGRGAAIVMAVLSAVLLRFAGHAAKNVIISRPDYYFLIYLVPIFAIFCSLIAIFTHGKISRIINRVFLLKRNSPFQNRVHLAEEKKP